MPRQLMHAGINPTAGSVTGAVILWMPRWRNQESKVQGEILGAINDVFRGCWGGCIQCLMCCNPTLVLGHTS